MGDELDISVIKKTQESLASIIKKPPLTEKLLRKPPFRFLHDIISNVINATGFLKDVYTPEELNSDNIKDKDSKIKFLQKVIDEVGDVLGEPLSIRPNKVVAGHEADKTNIFLQALAKAAQSSNGNQNIVRSTKKSEKSPSKKTSRKADPSQERKKSEGKSNKEKSETKEKTRSRSHDKTSTSKDEKLPKDSKKSSTSLKDGKSKSTSSRTGGKEKTGTRESHRSRKTNHSSGEAADESPEKTEKKSPSKRSANSPRHLPVQQDDEDENANDANNNHDNNNNNEVVTAPVMNGDGGLVELVAEQSGGGEGDGPSTRPGTGRPQTSTRPAPMRPFSTRPSTSTIKRVLGKHLIMSPVLGMNKEDEMIRPVTSMNNRLRSARPASARPPPPVVKLQRSVAEEAINIEAVKPVANVIVESDKDNEDDDTFVIEETAVPLEVEPEVNMAPPADINIDGDHGSLVAQILETKKDLETGSQAQTEKKVEIDKSMTADVSRRKERDVVTKEIDKMRSSIQTLTRSINPLGKMIDYLQEDIDSMQKELGTWQHENQQHVQTLKREQSSLETSVEPLKAQLEELEQTIQDQLEKIGNVKANVLRNEDKIQKLLASAKS